MGRCDDTRRFTPRMEHECRNPALDGYDVGDEVENIGDGQYRVLRG